MPSAPSIATSVTVRLVLPARATAVSEMTGVIEAAAGVVTELDVTASGASQIRIGLTMLTHDPEHADTIVERMREVQGVEIGRVSDRTFLLHLGGKLSAESKVPSRSRDLSMIALRVVGKPLEDVRLVMSGAGAAGTAILKLFLEAGAHHVVVADIESMAPDSMVFAMANPVPEIDPDIAARHVAVVATGRSDVANQINNVLVFPGAFRGLIDSGVSHVSTDGLLAAAEAPADVVHDDERNATYIIPGVFHPEVSHVVAEAVRAAVARREPA